MKFLYRWLDRKLRDARGDRIEASLSTAIVRESDTLRSDPINLKMYKANGGWAIEFYQYNRKTDNNDISLHVVNNGQDLGDTISKIITYEALKR
jgi:hypothetical protein